MKGLLNSSRYRVCPTNSKKRTLVNRSKLFSEVKQYFSLNRPTSLFVLTFYSFTHAITRYFHKISFKKFNQFLVSFSLLSLTVSIIIINIIMIYLYSLSHAKKMKPAFGYIFCSDFMFK
jgi:hypothetical protein